MTSAALRKECLDKSTEQMSEQTPSSSYHAHQYHKTKLTYRKKECSVRPNKTEKNRVCLTAGGDKLTYAGDTATQCTSLTTAKKILNSTISTPGARFGCIDIKNMYYGTPMNNFKYMKIKQSEIPPDIIAHY